MNKKRKTPIKHIVHEHYRNGKKVEEYDRGKGQSKSSKKRTMPPAPRSIKPKAYTVNFTYSKKKGDGESFFVIARSYKHALAEAFEEKKDKRHPIEISIIDPSIGDALRYIGRGATTAAKAGAEYTIRHGKNYAVARIKDELAKLLIKNAYSENMGTRIIARKRLKEEYPNVYNIMDFSTRRKKKTSTSKSTSRKKKSTSRKKKRTSRKKKRTSRKKITNPFLVYG